MRKKKVLVFGIFDILHPGHIEFLKAAKQKGDYLVVAVGQAAASRKFKGRAPKHSLKDRLKLVESVKYVDEAIAGDTKQGSYGVIRRKDPDMVCFGYDQEELAKDFTSWAETNSKKIKTIFLKGYKSFKYKTHLLTKY